MENCQIGVFLAYGSRRGAAFLDRELYLPQNGRRTGCGGSVPEGVAFRTKAGSALLPPDTKPRGGGQPKNNEPLWADTDLAQVRWSTAWKPTPLRLGLVANTTLVGAGSRLAAGSIADPEDLAYYACFGTGDVSLAELARVAGTRIEDTAGGGAGAPAHHPGVVPFWR